MINNINNRLKVSLNFFSIFTSQHNMYRAPGSCKKTFLKTRIESKGAKGKRTDRSLLKS